MTVALAEAPTIKLVDIEMLVQWALEQTGYLPWRAVTERELQYDHGYTAIPHGVSKEYKGRGAVLRTALNGDANAVLDAIKGLPPRSAVLVIRYGRDQKRPPDFTGIEPRRVWHQMPKKKGKRKGAHRKRPRYQGWDIHPDTIAAARAEYALWHEALTALMEKLTPVLIGHRITGFSARPNPWRQHHA